MIIIKPNVYNVIDNYVDYLISSGETSQKRAIEKRVLMLQSLMTNLGYVVNGTTLHRVSPYPDLGGNKGYRIFVYTDKWTKTTKWGFGYEAFKTRKGIKVVVHHMKNMQLLANNQSNPNQVQQNKQQQPQQTNQKKPQYKPVSKECFGLTRVQATNGTFNYLKNNQLFCKQWYQDAKDFQQFSNKQIATKVFDGQTVYWLYLDGNLEKAKPGSYIPEYREITDPQILFEADRMRILDVMKRVCKY